jgi:hypothetical protein
MLSAAQSAALGHVEVTADARESRSLLSIAGILERAGYGLETYRAVIELARQHARIALPSTPIGLVMRRSVWLRVSSETVCTETSTRRDSQAGARRLSRAASGISGSVRCLEELITPRAYWLQSAPNTDHLSWFDSLTGRRRGSDRVISSSVTWAHGLPLHSWAASTRKPAVARAPSQNLMMPWRHCFPKLKTAVWLHLTGLRFVRRRLAFRALPWVGSAILARVCATLGRTRRVASRDVW